MTRALTRLIPRPLLGLAVFVGTVAVAHARAHGTGADALLDERGARPAFSPHRIDRPTRVHSSPSGGGLQANWTPIGPYGGNAAADMAAFHLSTSPSATARLPKPGSSSSGAMLSHTATALPFGTDVRNSRNAAGESSRA